MQLIYIVLGVLSVAVNTIRCEAPTYDKTTDFLNKKLENYDKLERPYYKGKALDVAVSAYILDLFEINEKEQTFSINLYLRHQWKDPRLEFTEEEAGTSRINLSKEFAGKIWMVATPVQYNPFIDPPSIPNENTASRTIRKSAVEYSSDEATNESFRSLEINTAAKERDRIFRNMGRINEKLKPNCDRH